MKTNKLAFLTRVGVAVLCATFAACSAASAAEAQADASAVNPVRVLLKSALRLGISAQVSATALEMVKGTDEKIAAEVAAADEVYRSAVGTEIREELLAVFGDSARSKFESFIDEFTQAETSADAEYLKNLAETSGDWKKTPDTYAALRAAVVQEDLAGDIAEAGRFLAEVQTWCDMKKKDPGVPPVRIWLDRGIQPKQAKQSKNPLREAEASVEDFADDGTTESAGVLESFGEGRKARRIKALEEAQAGMRQVAEERRAAEDEEAGKKIVAAQVEAEAVRKHAEKLAASQAQAIEQRRNSWSSRLKSVLTTAIGATSGVFLGEVGGRAGRAAADAVFNTDRDHQYRR